MKKYLLTLLALLGAAVASYAAAPEAATLVTNATTIFESAATLGVTIIGLVLAIKLVRKFVR